MALRIWLPLNGDLRNLGCSNITITPNASATVQNSGKIGKCYCPATMNLTDFNNLSFDNSSFCFWAKTSSTTSWQLIMGIDNTSLSQIHGIYVADASRYKLEYNPSLNIYDAAISQWHHYAFVIKNGNSQAYYDGVLKTTSTEAVTNDAIGRIRLGVGAAISLNDVRIYDHCLSAAEVYEISQGLVLHYKLDSTYSESSQNLCTAIRPATGTNVTWGGHIAQWTNYDATNDPVPFNEGTQGEIVYGTNGSTGGGASRSICTIAASPSTTYTYSCYIKASDNLAYVHANFLYKYEYTAISGGTKITESGYFASSRKELLSNGWYRIWGTFTTQSNTNCIIMSFFTYPGKNVTYWLGGWQIEQKDHVTPFMSPGASRTGYIQDSSGYGHNGVIIGDLILNSDTKKYSISTKWNSSAPTANNETGICYIQTPITLTTPLQMSITWWAKPENGYGGGTNHAAFCTSNSASRPTDYNSTAFHHRDAGFDIYPSDGSGVKRLTFNQYTANEWHHYAIIYNGTNAYAYKDGVQTATVTIGTNKTLATFTQLFIGYSQAGGVKRKTLGSYSDFRIYCTALSTDDILALYHTGAKIDNKANFHTFEFNEFNTNKLTKTGIMNDNMEESIITLPDGSCWQLLLFHYVDGGKNLFTSSNATDCNEFGLFSRLKDINNFTYNGKYEFYVIQDDVEYRWTQTNQPTASTISGLTTVSGYTNPVNGLAKANQSNTYIGYNAWWGACGCWTSYSTGGKTGIPGFGAHNANGICTRYMALYARIEKADVKISNQTLNASEIIEL